MIVEIEGYETEAFVSGKKCSAGKLLWQMKKVIEHTEDHRYFTSLFCLMFGYDRIIYSDEISADFVIDIDTYRVYKPMY